MSGKRDSGFPASSIGRSAGAAMLRSSSPSPSLTGSRESLTAHPLLSPSHSPPPVTTSPSSSTDQNSLSPAGATRYATYTPRHRTAAAATVTSSLSVSPQHQQVGGATSKLQHVNLRALAQSIGVETGSVGWEMLENLIGEHEHSPEWTDIWNALTTGKATLLLPLEQAHNVAITPDFIKDHVVLCDSKQQDTMPIVTLSGLRGTLFGHTLNLRSTLQPGSKPFTALTHPGTRSTALAALPPLPLISASPLSQSYPSYALPSHTEALPLPLHAIPKPPLPPRPGQRPSSSQGAPSRLTSSFASLFGKQAPPATPIPTISAPESEHPAEVPAFTIDRRISLKDVSLQINKALKAELKETLAMSGAPPWVVDLVQEFSAGLYPFVKNTNPAAPRRVKGATPPYIVDPPQETADELSKQFQDFYAELEHGIMTRESPAPSISDSNDGDPEKQQEKRHRSGTLTEEDVHGILEAVERVMCSLFYDRLYMQPKSDDNSHDEALSGRIAALNMLDLNLEHLGVDVGKVGTEVEVVLQSCGETLAQLERSACRCPGDKCAIMVAAHKILVDGLSRLPPIRIKTETELLDQTMPESPKLAKSPKTTADDKAQNKPDAEIIVPRSPYTPPVVLSSEPPETEDTSSFSEIPPDHPDVLDPSTSDKTLRPVSSFTPPATPTPVSGDLIIPLMIYAVVKSNPPHLLSHLLFSQRFRNQRFGGEESYCLVNLLAVADFLENVDLKALGLGDRAEVSAAELSPIPIAHTPFAEAQAAEGVPARFRRGVEQQVDAIAGSANKVLAGVVDSSFGVLRSLLPGQPPPPPPPADESAVAAGEGEPVSWNARPSFGLLRRESGFSIASLAASLPGRDRGRSVGSASVVREDESGQMMVEVSSRPGSVHSAYLSDEAPSESESAEDDEDDEEEDEDKGDGRSIRSFESMMKKSKKKKDMISRKSLSDRLASMPGLGRLAAPQPGSPPPSHRSSLLYPASNRLDTPVSSRAASPSPIRIAPPNKRFLECSEDDLRMSEVRELLHEYRRVVDALQKVGGFAED
ncbi:hypothetical protein K488DRAFT_56987 [Vararia minispora EC-137]|uniref:Uncharacterized protein n=1 Tax=Vararia minispora EC-137 TaxID=1314806 RepID=A0ACB8QD20_9AGAM|nr:hypothetical protein K488DRAFT_56987 [Vararia minispora EC-137]